MKSILFFLFIILLSNLIFAQESITKIGQASTIKEVKKYFPEIESIDNKITKRLIKQDDRIKKNINAKDENSYLKFYDEAGNLIKELKLKKDTNGRISEDYRHVMLNIPDHPQYPGSYKNEYYNAKGDLLFEMELPYYRLKASGSGNFYTSNDEYNTTLSIYDINGNLLNRIEHVVFTEDIYKSINNLYDFKMLDNGNAGYFFVGLNKNGEIKWKIKCSTKVTKRMVAVSDELQKVFIGDEDKIKIVDFDGRIVDEIKLNYDYGSYLGLSNNEKILAIVNVESPQYIQNDFYLYDILNKKVLYKNTLPQFLLKRKKIIDIKITNNGEYILLKLRAATSTVYSYDLINKDGVMIKYWTDAVNIDLINDKIVVDREDNKYEIYKLNRVYVE